MPPMMTMTKASMITVAAMPWDAVTSGAASTPPRAASPQPMPNTPERTRLDVDAERMHHLGVLRGGADQQAEPRPLEQLPDGERHHDAGGGQEQPVDGKRLAQQEHDARQQLGRRHLQRVGSPDQPDHLA